MKFLFPSLQKAPHDASNSDIPHNRTIFVVDYVSTTTANSKLRSQLWNAPVLSDFYSRSME